mmetsp:Transcript_84539/g.149696  ORF Transcript_84539/g.149696 Transcript_84539/m.149696 type:complete len:209 (-) Transcript_84539:189-815(-)
MEDSTREPVDRYGSSCHTKPQGMRALGLVSTTRKLRRKLVTAPGGTLWFLRPDVGSDPRAPDSPGSPGTVPPAFCATIDIRGIRGSEDPTLLNPTIDCRDVFDTQEEDVPWGSFSFSAIERFFGGEVKNGRMGDFPICTIGAGASPSKQLQPTGGGTGPGGMRVQWYSSTARSDHLRLVLPRKSTKDHPSSPRFISTTDDPALRKTSA